MGEHRHIARWGALKTERSSWDSHWRELSENLQPRLGRFAVSDANKGGKRHTTIYDNTGTRALRVLSAGLMAGMTSPARPWFRLSTADPELAEFHAVKTWLSDVRRIMLDVYARSNTYRALQGIYEELGLFGTAASILLPDFDKVQHHYPATVGEYAIATDHRGKVNSFYREMPMTVGAMVEAFGYAPCSQTVRTAFDRGNYDMVRTVMQAIEPRRERDQNRPDARNMPYASCYFEQGAREGEYLRESGFKRFRVLAPRWHATGGDIYGHSPGMEALGDVKQLQHEQLRKSQGIDYQTRPPLQAPTALKGQAASMVPGGMTYFDAAPTGGVKPLFESQINLNYLLEDIRDVRERINSAFYVDLFLMLASATRESRMTATEVAERHEEKLLMLGPVLERLHDELLDPMIEMTFTDLLEAGALPPPPAEMQGMGVRVEFVSMLAQAQRAVGTASIDRFVGNLGQVASFRPDVLDKFDADKWVDQYSDALGVDPDIVVPTEKAMLVREERAKAQQAAEQAAMAEQMASAGQKLGSTPTQGGASDGLTDILGLFSGYNSPGAETY